MFCSYCGAKMDVAYDFCPNCGAKNPIIVKQPFTGEEKTVLMDSAEAPVKPAAEIPMDQPKPDDEISTAETPAENPTEEPATEILSTEAPDLDSGSEKTVAYFDTPPSSYAAPNIQQGPLPYSQGSRYTEPQHFGAAPEKPLNNAYGYTPPAPASPKPEAAPKAPKAKKVYRKTSAGIRVISVFLCLLVFLFGTIAVTLAGIRIGLSEDNVRAVCRSGSFTELTEYTANGERPLAEVLFEGVIDSRTNQVVQLNRDQINSILKKAKADAFIEDLAVDYQQYFLHGRIPFKLNAAEISKFFENLNDVIYSETRCKLPQSYIDGIKGRVDDGDLSFLSIDSTGGGFKKHYGIDPKLISYGVSVWSMILFIVLTVLLIALIFIINGKNPLSGFGCNGVTLVILGGLYFLSGIAGLIVSLVKTYYPITAALKYVSIGLGIAGLIVLVIGILFLIIKGILKKRAVVE